MFGASARGLEMETQEAKRADVAAAPATATGGEVVKPAAGDAGAVAKMSKISFFSLAFSLFLLQVSDLQQLWPIL